MCVWLIRRQEQVDRICEMYNERLHVPQTTLDDTSSAYSTFLSAHCPDDYEARMVEVTKFSQVAKKKLAEKRYGKTRSDFEDQLVRVSHDVRLIQSALLPGLN